MQMIATIALDIAKSVFQVHGIDAEGDSESGLTLSSAYARGRAREKSLKNFPWECPNASYPQSVNGATGC
jgi:hypothetical protein